MNHFAVYDIFSLSLKLQETLEDVSLDEIQMFSYLSCLLSVYDGHSANKWGYFFIKNEIGAPYSDQLENSLTHLVKNNFFQMKDEEYFTVNNIAVDKYNMLTSLDSYKAREHFLDAATKCIKFVPYGDVRKALHLEPTLNIAKGVDNRRILLDTDGASIELLYKQFETLHTALEDKYKNLVIPALVWMSFNSKKQFG